MSTRNRKTLPKKAETSLELVDRIKNTILNDKKKTKEKKILLKEEKKEETELKIFVSKTLINKCLKLKYQKDDELKIEKDLSSSSSSVTSESTLEDEELIENIQDITNKDLSEEKNSSEEIEDEESEGEEMIMVLNRKGEELWLKDNTEVYKLDVNGEGEFIGLMEETSKIYDFIYKNKKYKIVK